MGMDLPEILEVTCGYLRQIPHMDDKDPIEVPPDLLQVLDSAATEAKMELECKCTAFDSEARVLTCISSPRSAHQGLEIPHCQSVQRSPEDSISIAVGFYPQGFSQLWSLLDLHLRFHETVVAQLQRWVCD